MNLVSRTQAVSEGLPRYFTGEPCKHGHVAERYTASKTCCVCANAKANATKSKNMAKYSQSSLEWARRNPERAAEYQLRANRKNPGRRNRLTADYRSAKAHRCPAWLSEDDKWMIHEAYVLAATRSKVTGVSWHVDHIVPLRGTTVSGLHVPWNLQVITGCENVRKGNRYA